MISSIAEEPLLQEAKSSLPAKMQVPSLWDRCRHRISRWWKASVDPSYLTSTASRRFLQPALLVAALYSVMVDIIQNDHGWRVFQDRAEVHYNVFTVLSTLIGLCYPRTTLWRDFWLAALFGRFAISSKWHNEHWVIVIFLGVNVVPQIGWLMASMTYGLLRSPEHEESVILRGLFGLVICTAIAAWEYRVVLNFHEAERNRLTAMRLLTHVTDGYCSVDPKTFLITFANASFEKTFGGHSMVGRCLTDLVLSSDHARLVDHLEQSDAPPTWVTCIASSVNREFDVKVISYVVCEDSVELCIQIQGELRPMTPPAPVAYASTAQRSLKACGDIFAKGVFTKALSSKRGDDAGSSRASSVAERHSLFENEKRRLAGDKNVVHGNRRDNFLDEVGSQASKMTVCSFWDSLRNITGRDVRPRHAFQHHMAMMPEITFDYEDVMDQLITEGAQPDELMNLLNRRMSELPPPPVSSKQWVAAAFRIAESSFFEWVVTHAVWSELKAQHRDHAQSSLNAAVLHAQPIDGLPAEATGLIAAATGTAGQPPPPPTGREPTPMISEFMSWFQSLYQELHPAEPALCQEELMEQWNAYALRELAVRGQEAESQLSDTTHITVPMEL